VFHPLVDQAIWFALAAHEGQMRKGQADMPYIVHPVHVGMILARHGFEPEVCCAGILHDVVEDCDVSLAELEARFGCRVAGWVDEVSEDRSRTWSERKNHTIRSIAGMSDEARAVTAADKLHNLAGIEEQRAMRGEEIWSVFTKGREETLQYYRSVAEQLHRHYPHPLCRELWDLARSIDHEVG
jgi:(p)ppGpp synthase/HD superfamily hydrolase